MEPKNLNDSEENINSAEELKNDKDTQPKSNKDQLIRRPTRDRIPPAILGPTPIIIDGQIHIPRATWLE